MAAQTLVEAGVHVTLLDVGVVDQKYQQLIPEQDFLTLRQSDPAQHRYFLGDDFEALSWGAVKTGAQLTAPRQFMTTLVDRFLPLLSDNFAPFESLAFGGLGNGWGVGCNVFSRPELAACGLDEDAMREAYRVVADRIGMSATQDDVTPYTAGHLRDVQPVSDLDSTAAPLLRRYARTKAVLNPRGFFLGRPALALLTRDTGERKKVAYHDLDFYTDRGHSAYRPWMTIERLKQHTGFTYLNSMLVVRFRDQSDGVEVHCLNTNTGERSAWRCKNLVLATGVFSTARIVLRSLPNTDKKLPFLCNPYMYLPCVQPALVGTATDRYRTGFAQLMMFHDAAGTNFDVAQASMYSYRSLLLFRLLKETPLNFRDGRILMQYLLPGLTLVGIHHPDTFSDNKYLSLLPDAHSPTGDMLKAVYTLSAHETAALRAREKKFAWAFRALRCCPLKRVYPGPGSSIHYAGTLPFSRDPKEFTLSPQGQLHGTSRVFVADGSGLRYAPAKGLTLTLMANAHNVAVEVGKHAFGKHA